MINVGVVSDTTWDNYILVDKKFKKLNSEKFRIHAIYGKTIELFSILSNKYSLTMNRHYSDNISNTLCNMLKICDIWLIFTNCIEYLTSTQLVIEMCDKYEIKYIIIGEYNKDNNFYSFEHDSDCSFKKIMKKLEPKSSDYSIEEFNYDNYNNNFCVKQFIPLSLSPSIRDKIRTTYNETNELKNSRTIKLLYDKDEIKREKAYKKTVKESKQLEFANNRLSYYKKNTSS